MKKEYFPNDGVGSITIKEFTIVACAFCGGTKGPFERWLDGKSYCCEDCLARSGLRVVKTSGGAVSLIPTRLAVNPATDVNHARKVEVAEHLTDCPPATRFTRRPLTPKLTPKSIRDTSLLLSAEAGDGALTANQPGRERGAQRPARR